MAGLVDKKIQDSYKSLLRVDDDTNGIDGSLADITDGEGTTGPFQISQTEVSFPSSSTLRLVNLEEESATQGFHINLTDSNGDDKNKISIPDNVDTAFSIKESGNVYMKFTTTNSSERIEFGKNVEMQGNLQVNGTIEGSSIDFSNVDMDNVDIDSGAIDGTPIGANSANTGAFTTLTATTASSGASAHASADEIVAEGSANSGVSILSGTSGEGAIYFGDSGDNDIGRIRYNHSGNSMDFKTNTSVAMTIDSSQRVGIGTTSPDTKLTIAEARQGNASDTIGNRQILHIDDTTAWSSLHANKPTGGGVNFSGVYNSSNDQVIFGGIRGLKENNTDGNYDGALVFGTVANGGNMAEKARIDHDGKFGIGTSSPVQKLTVEGDATDGGTGNDGQLALRGATNTNLRLMMGMDTSSEYGFISPMKLGTAWHNLSLCYNGGNVGIGDNAPATKLDVNGDIQIQGANAMILNHTTGSASDTYINSPSSDVMAFRTGGTERMRITSDGELLIKCTSLAHDYGDERGQLCISSVDHGSNNNYAMLQLQGHSNSNSVGTGAIYFFDHSNNVAIIQANRATSTSTSNLLFYTNAGSGVAERMRITSSGLMQSTSGITFTGTAIATNETGIASSGTSGNLRFYTNGNQAMTLTTGKELTVARGSTGIGGTINAYTQDGRWGIMVDEVFGNDALVDFRDAGSSIGNITIVSGNVSYNTFIGSHYSSLKTDNEDDIEIGTVLSTIDETHTRHLAKFKVSDVVSDTRVYGVFAGWDGMYEGEGTQATISALGATQIRVTGACAGGDLLESNGDGTAKVQDDDIIRSKTIGKVTIGDSNTGVKLVSCVLYCG